MRADAIVIGGGPAGCFAGKLLAERGFEVVIVEEHAEIGHPVCCTGVVGAGGLRELGIKLDGLILNEIESAVFYPPSCRPSRLTRDRVEALIIDRGELDRRLAIEAVEAGATLLMKTRCTGLSLNDRASVGLRGVSGYESMDAELVIGADGLGSIVARRAGLLKAPQYIRCAQLEVLAEVDADAVELYFGRKFAPGFFGWLVPAGDVCRVGLGTTQGSPARRLAALMRRHPVLSKKVKGGKTLHLAIGRIPGSPMAKAYADRVMLVGDAAGQVKPLTGGGIYVGLSCAKLCAEVAAKALERGGADERSLSAYGRVIKERFGLDFKLGMRAREILQKMSDEDLNLFFELLAREEVRALVLERADFDRHGESIKEIARRALGLLRPIGPRRFITYLLRLLG